MPFFNPGQNTVIQGLNLRIQGLSGRGQMNLLMCKLNVHWRGGSQVDRKATERVYAGGKDTERVEDGPDSADMEEERGCA